VSEDFDIALLSVLGQLVEAREDQGDAERRLQEYRAAETPPEIPNEFEDVDAFLDYHHRRQSYENHLRQHENALKTAKREYTEAAEQLLVFLPDGVPLRYTYEGERSELFGAEYVIVRKQGEILIENPSRATS
jgi:LmbE family N-acetylglucosaminyl deacetylase